MVYELLTGKPPFDTETLLGGGLLEFQRRLREQEPKRPSTRVTATPNLAEFLARTRSVSATTLARKLHGELDWIVMRALEKDPNRRYQSAGALAEDLRRYLRHEPVTAGPPSATYRLRKFARRHRYLRAGRIVGLRGTAGRCLGGGLAVPTSARKRRTRERERVQGAAALGGRTNRAP
jgi:non-specific serine/threonine protein kinase/serine/threonine-protein kinase